MGNEFQFMSGVKPQNLESMKEFKDNLDEETTSEKKNFYECSRPEGNLTFRQKMLRWLSQYSLLIIVGLAALSITFLHVKGQYILEVLRGTPMPTFFLEQIIAPKPVPDKTKVYEETIKEEEKQQRQKLYVNNKLVKPHWQATPFTENTRTLTKVESSDTITVKGKLLTSADTAKLAKSSIVEKNKKVKKKPVPQRAVPAKQTPPENKQVDVDFFQPIKVGTASSGEYFIPCSVHGGQEVSNNQMLTLRLTNDMMVNGQQIPSGTLVYGTVRIAQNRIQVLVSRILQYAVQYQIHDHTYHEGILLDEKQNVWEDAARETAYRQGQRSVRDLPIAVATELGRSVLQNSKRKKSTIYLPDGYPLYLVKQ